MSGVSYICRLKYSRLMQQQTKFGFLLCVICNIVSSCLFRSAQVLLPVHPLRGAFQTGSELSRLWISPTGPVVGAVLHTHSPSTGLSHLLLVPPTCLMHMIGMTPLVVITFILKQNHSVETNRDPLIRERSSCP